MDILFGVRLYRYGIDAHAGRHTGRLALAAGLRASVLADLTGISVGTVERWSHRAKRDWVIYVAQRVDDTEKDRENLPSGTTVQPRKPAQRA